MILGAKNYHHDYLVHKDSIAYKDQDGISNKIRYGFSTIFAYLFEYERNRISKGALDKALELNIVIA